MILVPGSFRRLGKSQVIDVQALLFKTLQDTFLFLKTDGNVSGVVTFHSCLAEKLCRRQAI